MPTWPRRSFSNPPGGIDPITAYQLYLDACARFVVERGTASRTVKPAGANCGQDGRPTTQGRVGLWAFPSNIRGRLLISANDRPAQHLARRVGRTGCAGPVFNQFMKRDSRRTAAARFRGCLRAGHFCDHRPLLRGPPERRRRARLCGGEISARRGSQFPGIFGTIIDGWFCEGSRPAAVLARAESQSKDRQVTHLNWGAHGDPTQRGHSVGDKRVGYVF